ncbi:uncharacterized protein A4U43_C01F25700 [Asparagus officinalis]|uniref:Uncharacterized protein n=1 Tax=Asparagus officinalis TaxID=4686 RepID=A0A5P1FSE0_ASPOF|nr:uncharacterized protein A4U43_C01F25700 [Asparagus officinalis]
MNPPDNTKPKQPQQKPALHWARHVSSTCLHHLSRPANAGPLLFTCLCLALAYKNRNRKWGPRGGARRDTRGRGRGRGVLPSSCPMAAPGRRWQRMALRRIMDSQGRGSDQRSAGRRTAAKLEMSGKEDEAVEMLQKALKEAEKDGKPHEAYELEMLLVEMLIYKGNYQDALKCKCLNDKEISDARGPLYQAVVHLIEGNRDRSTELYKEFQDIRSRLHWPDNVQEGSPLYDAVHDFQVFEKIVNNLKKEIEHAHNAKQANKSS